MTRTTPLWTPKRTRQAGALAVVLAAHAGLFLVIGRTVADPPMSLTPPPIFVELVAPPPPPPPPPPPDLPPSPQAGGGAPAAPSRIHTPPEPPPEIPREVPAPVQQAPAPTLVVGTAPISSPTPGMGQGGVGTGAGTGVGAGSGPGSGGGTRPVIITGPTRGQISQAHPREAFRRRIDGRVELRCVIRQDTRLENCQVLNETPGGMGFGDAALRLASSFRFRPATENGRPVEGGTIRPWVIFGNPDRDAPPVG